MKLTVPKLDNYTATLMKTLLMDLNFDHYFSSPARKLGYLPLENFKVYFAWIPTLITFFNSCPSLNERFCFLE